MLRNNDLAAKRKKAPARRSTSRPPSRRKRAKKSTRRSVPKLKVAFLLLLLSVLVGGGVWVYYYTKFARLIEARLKVHPERVTAIYSRPLQVRKGQSLTLAHLTHRLDRAGYRRSSGPGVGKWYVAEEGSLRIGQWREGRSEELRLSFSGGQDSSRVSSIQSRGRETDTAHLAGQFLSNFYNRSREKKKHVSYHELPEDLVEAVLAAEDEDFFEHPGLDITGLARALLVNVSRGSAAQGGSTLTQQFVKN